MKKTGKNVTLDDRGISVEWRATYPGIQGKSHLAYFNTAQELLPSRVQKCPRKLQLFSLGLNLPPLRQTSGEGNIMDLLDIRYN